MDAAYHVQSKEGVEFDEAMEVAEDDRQRQVHDIAWIASEKTPEFDDLGEAEYEDNLSNHQRLASCWVKICCCLPQRKWDEGIHDEGK